MGQIKVNETGFSTAAGLQQTIIDDLCTEYEDMQGYMENLSASWKGNSGESFRQAVASLQQQLLTGSFTLEQLRQDTLSAKDQFVQRDQAMARLMELKK